MKHTAVVALIITGIDLFSASPGSATDRTPPRISITVPTAGATCHYLTPLYGWVHDEAGGSRVKHIDVTLVRKWKRRRYYWDGFKWSASPRRTASGFWYLADLSAGRWSYIYGPTRRTSEDGHGSPYYGPQLLSGTYVFRVTATDRAGNSRSAWRTMTVRADTKRPSVAFLGSRKGIYRSFQQVHGIAWDKGGSGLREVLYSIKRVKDGYRWDGQSWLRPYGPSGNPPEWLPATFSRGRWKLGRQVPRGIALAPDLYEVEIGVRDRAFNESWREFYDPDPKTTNGDFHVYPSLAFVRVR